MLSLMLKTALANGSIVCALARSHARTLLILHIRLPRRLESKTSQMQSEKQLIWMPWSDVPLLSMLCKGYHRHQSEYWLLELPIDCCNNAKSVPINLIIRRDTVDTIWMVAVIPFASAIFIISTTKINQNDDEHDWNKHTQRQLGIRLFYCCIQLKWCWWIIYKHRSHVQLGFMIFREKMKLWKRKKNR